MPSARIKKIESRSNNNKKKELLYPFAGQDLQSLQLLILLASVHSALCQELAPKGPALTCSCHALTLHRCRLLLPLP